jgi:hypothetical protein
MSTSSRHFTHLVTTFFQCFDAYKIDKYNWNSSDMSTGFTRPKVLGKAAKKRQSLRNIRHVMYQSEEIDPILRLIRWKALTNLIRPTVLPTLIRPKVLSIGGWCMIAYCGSSEDGQHRQISWQKFDWSSHYHSPIPRKRKLLLRIIFLFSLTIK